MDGKNKWQKFNEAWNSFFGKSVIKNEHLSKVLKHSFLGVMIPTTFVVGTKKITSRVSVFLIQNSGTAKSVALKATHELLGICNKQSFYTLKTTDAKLTGSFDPPKKKDEKPIQIPGLLSTLSALFWDEGSILLKEGPYSETLADILQMALDDPGRVSRAMKWGTIDEPTNCTVVTGSYFIPKMADVIINRGLFQRFYVVYYLFSDEEIREIDNMLNGLFSKDNISTETEINTIKECLQNFPEEIEVNKEDLKRIYEEKIMPFRDVNLFKQYKGIKEDILKSFWFRLRMKMMKFALHYAVLNDKSIIDYEALEYGFQFVVDELDYIKQILDTTQIEETKTGNDRKSIIKDLLREPKTRPDLLELLKNRTNWDIGYNRTVIFLDLIEEEGIIKVDRSKKPHVYSWT